MKEKSKTTEFVKEHKMSLFVIVSAIIMLVGLSYAWLQLTLRGEKELNLKAGTLELNLDDTMTGGISLADAIPVTDEEGLTSTAYTFTLENTGTINSSYEIYLDDLDLGDGETRMNNDFIKYQLTRDDEVIGYDLLSTIGTSPNRLFDKGEIASKEKYTYTLRMWINENATNEVMGTIFKGKLRVEAIQTKNVNAVEKLLSKVNGDYRDYDTATETEKREMFSYAQRAVGQRVDWTTDELMEYRYVGATPNNYVTFNDELWRIIGVFTVEDENGKKEQRVKMIREESIGNYRFADSLAERPSDWTDSVLQQMLNSGPYYNRTSGKCPDYQDGQALMTDCDFSSTGLTEISKSMIGKTKWYLGGIFKEDLTTGVFYDYERDTKVYSEHSTSWVGDVGLMYPSDYGYAAGSSSCISTNLSSYATCKNNDWLNSSGYKWTISPLRTEPNIYIISNGGVQKSNTSSKSFSVYPTIYLKSSILITGGNGSSTNPYKLK